MLKDVRKINVDAYNYRYPMRYFWTSVFVRTVVPVMNGHPRDQAKVSVHERWPLIGGTVGRPQT